MPLRVKILLVLCWCITNVQAQTRPLRAQQFTTTDGLTSNIISSVIQDHYGYLWMRTEFGIARFDGYQFESFDYDPNNASRPYQKVHVNDGLFPDRRGNIWLNYDGIGVSYFDYQEGRYNHFKPKSDLDEGYIGNNDVYCFETLSAAEVLLGTQRGIFKFDYRTQEFEQLVEGIPVRCLEVDNVGNIWIGTGILDNDINGQGLYLFESSTRKLRKIGASHERVNDILQDEKGRIWMATNKGVAKIMEYSPGVKDFSETHYTIKPIDVNDGVDQQRNNVNQIRAFGDGYIWFMGDLGLIRVKAADFSLKAYLSSGGDDGNGQIRFTDLVTDANGRLWAVSNNNNYGLAYYNPERDNFVSNVDKATGVVMKDGRLLSGFIGRDNTMWLGTERYGLLKIDLEQKRFHTLRNGTSNNSLGSNNVYSITPGFGNSLWMGTSNGITRFFPDDLTTVSYTKQNLDMNGNVVFCTYVDSRGYLWLGHNPDQVSRIDVETMQNYPFKYILDSDTTGFYAWAISQFAEDRKGNIWVATHSGGIYKCIGGEREFVNYRFGGENQSISLTTNAIHFDTQQTLWVGTTFGLYFLDPQKDKLEEFVAWEGQKQFREAITVIHEADQGFWIGTQSGGLVYLNTTERSVKRFTMKDGLPSNTINAILQENDNVLWISTNNGISRFDHELQEFANYSINDGLPSNYFNMNSAYKDDKGVMYFGSQDGVVYFSPGDIKPNPFQAAPVITGIQLFNRPVLVGDTINKQVVLQQPIMALDAVTLNHRNNIIAFSFSSMHFASPENNRYAYKLENLEEDWNYIDASRRTATYTSLPNGTYTFRLRATNSDGVWGEQEASLQVLILPPWWNTNWFRLVMLAMLLFLIYALYRLRIRGIKARNINLKKLVAEKTKGLEKQNHKIQKMADRLHEADQSKLKFFMNVSHEFRTPLTLILGPISDLLKSTRLSTTEKDELKLIERNGYRLLRLTNQLLDSSDLDRDTLRLQVAKSDIAAFIKGIAQAFEFRADNMDIDYRFESNVKSAPGWFDGDKIEKILYNLISNALKFTNVRGRIRVKLLIKDQQLRLEVIDNGIGMEQGQLDRVFERFYQVEETNRRRMGTGIGLNLAKKLAEKHKGTLTATSQVNQGTTFVLTIPLGQDVYSQEEKVAEPVNVTERAWQIQKLFAAESRTDTDPVIRQAEMGIVLLIEDSVDMRAYLKNGLKAHFSVIEATNGEEGLKLAEEMVPDIIVCDVMMPIMDGMEFCKHLKDNELLNHIPVILLTAKVGEENQMDGYQVGADDYLTKPIDMNLLRVRIHNLIKSRNELRNYFTANAELIPDKIANNRKDQIFLERAVKVVEMNLSDTGLNYQQFVEELGISKSRLYERINKISGLSINLFIRSIRLKIAAKKILEAQYTVAEVAYEVGFSDPGYFTKCFKQQFGVPPKDYAEAHSAQLTINN